jgi:predicted HicB family RNase H-like nuclease
MTSTPRSPNQTHFLRLRLDSTLAGAISAFATVLQTNRSALVRAALNSTRESGKAPRGRMLQAGTRSETLRVWVTDPVYEATVNAAARHGQSISEYASRAAADHVEHLLDVHGAELEAERRRRAGCSTCPTCGSKVA